MADISWLTETLGQGYSKLLVELAPQSVINFAELLHKMFSTYVPRSTNPLIRYEFTHDLE